jgi:Domain of unknown function (DUF4158)
MFGTFMPNATRRGASTYKRFWNASASNSSIAPRIERSRSGLLPTALQTTQGVVLAEAAIEELRRRRIVLPPVLVIERVCAEVATRAQRQIHKVLSEWLTNEQRTKLDQLLESREAGSHSILASLRLPPGVPSACRFDELIQLKWVRLLTQFNIG